MIEIISGKLKKAQKVVLYGPEGIGKSTFASKFPDPLFIDTEGSTAFLDVKRFNKPTSWALLKEMVKEVKNNPDLCNTLVIDTADWAETLATENVCSTKNVQNIEDIGYGKGYTYLWQEFGGLLNLLEELIDKGINVLLLAHAQMRKFEQPDEMGAYDRWELKLQKKIAPMVKEWADCVLFANYKTMIIEDSKTKSKKAAGGQRVMYTTHHPAWDAKNRYGLKEVEAFDVGVILPHLFIKEAIKSSDKVPFSEVDKITPKKENSFKIPENMKPETKKERYFYHPKWIIPVKIEDDDLPTEKLFEEMIETSKEEFERLKAFDFGIKNKALADLMKSNQVVPFEIKNVVAKKGYYPLETPIDNYDDGFIDGVLVGAWKQVFLMILEERKNINFK